MVYRQVIVLKKQTIFVFILIYCLCIVPVCGENGPSVSAQSAVLYDPLSQQILYAKNEQCPMGMASTTKIMTALVALEQYDLEKVVTIQKEWTGIEGSSMYLRPGEQLKVSELLYGLLLASGNDAAVALAGIHPEGESGFVAQMNRKAEALGLKNTHFENPSGLDGKTHKTTALELAQLTAEAMTSVQFAEIVATRTIQIGDRWLSNHNRLLKEINACGVKTGFTKACGRCLVSAREQNGRMLICVTLNAPDDWNDHKNLYEYGFSQFQWVDLVGAGDCGSVPLVSADRKAVRLYNNESFSFYMNQTDREQLTISCKGPRIWYGAAGAGQIYGRLQVWLADHLLFETPVYFAETALEVQPENFWIRLRNFFFG